MAQAARADPPVVDCFDDLSARDGHASLCAPAAAPLSAHLMSLALVLRCRTAQQRVARAGRTSLGHASLCAAAHHLIISCHASFCAPAPPAPLSVHLMSRALVLRCRTAQQRVARAGRTSLGHASLCAFPAPLSVHHMSRALVLRLPHSSVARSVKMIFFATMGARGAFGTLPSLRYGTGQNPP